MLHANPFFQRWSGEISALIGGCILPFAFAPYYLWPLSIVSCMLLLFSLQNSNGNQSFVRGLLFATGFYALGVGWVYVSIHQHGASSAPLAFTLTAAFVVLVALFFALPFCLFGRYFSRSKLGLLIGFPALWVVSEWIRSWIFTGFPWLYLGYAGIDTPLTGMAPIFGVYALSFLLTLNASILFFAIKLITQKIRSNNSKQEILKLTIPHICALAAIWLLCWGLQQFNWTRLAEQPISIGMAQGNIPQEKKWDPNFAQPTLDIYRNLSSTLWQNDWVFWPEAAVPMTTAVAQTVLDQIDEQARETNTAFFTGIIADDPNEFKFYNSIQMLGEEKGHYYKQRLVPFGEYVPLEEHLRGLIAFFNLPTSYINIGPSEQPGLTLQGLKIAPSICYEIVYPDLMARLTKDAAVMITLSNDAWFGESIGPVQHFMMARMRAIETGRYLIRSTNNGYSGIIDEKGKVIVRGGRFTRENISGEFLPASGYTPFLIWRSWPIILLMGLILFLVSRARY